MGTQGPTKDSQDNSSSQQSRNHLLGLSFGLAHIMRSRTESSYTRLLSHLSSKSALVLILHCYILESSKRMFWIKVRVRVRTVPRRPQRVNNVTEAWSFAPDSFFPVTMVIVFLCSSWATFLLQSKELQRFRCGFAEEATSSYQLHQSRDRKYHDRKLCSLPLRYMNLNGILYVMNVNYCRVNK